jgi:transcriptional regulator with XRE-family HTH domain
MNRGFGARLQNCREGMNLGRKFVADEAGLSVRQLTRLESGRADQSDCTKEQISALSALFQKPVDWLVNGFSLKPHAVRLASRGGATQPELVLLPPKPVLPLTLSYGMDRCLTCLNEVNGIVCSHCGRPVE